MSKMIEIKILAEEGPEKTRLVSLTAKEYVANRNDRPLNLNELKSIKSIIAYQAYAAQMPESLVESEFCEAFGALALADLTADQYTAAVYWLVDWKLLPIQ